MRAPDEEYRCDLPILGTIELHFLIIVLQEVAIGTSQSLVILPKPRHGPPYHVTKEVALPCPHPPTGPPS